MNGGGLGNRGELEGEAPAVVIVGWHGREGYVVGGLAGNSGKRASRSSPSPPSPSSCLIFVDAPTLVQTGASLGKISSIPIKYLAAMTPI